MDGWVKLHRKILDWDWYKDTNTKVLFFHLLLRANIKDVNWKGITIERGQLFTSLQSLSSETNLSIKEIRNALKKLQKTFEIDVFGASNGTMITINKYDSYQHDENTKGKQRASEGQAKGKRGATNREEEERKEEKEYTFNFKKSFLELGVDEGPLDDWLNVRRNKKASNTQTAYNGIVRQIELSGLTANDCIKIAAENSWQGFKAEWVKNTTYMQPSQEAKKHFPKVLKFSSKEPIFNPETQQWENLPEIYK